ncbi:serine/threonine protein kinase, CMGC, dual-specificity [Neodidymelliopsis sp. IMI 364377]|nr:serine/threonine protein kinase, CMGC, dual-specificity [Neodidymelliopsis sp. IMI 364377]
MDAHAHNLGSNMSEDSSGSTDDRVRKFQKTGDHGSRLRKTSASNASHASHATAAARAGPSDTKPAAAQRRTAKVPLGPRGPPQDFSKHRVASTASLDNRSFLPTTRSDAAPASTMTPSTTHMSHTSNPRYSFAQQPDAARDPDDTSGSYDFLPTVNFDDFANSLSYEPDISDFPVPGAFKSTAPASANSSASTTTANTTTTNNTHASNMQPFTAGQADTRPSRSNSFMRRFSQSNTRKPGTTNPSKPPTSTNTVFTDNTAMPLPTTNMAIRTRRQSQFPAPAPPNPAARAPRKSVGPGMLPMGSFEGRSDVPRMASGTGEQNALGRSPSKSKASRRETLSANPNPPTAAPRLPSATRTAKAKSLQPPSRQTSGQHLSAHSLTPDQGSMPRFNGHSPGKSPAQPQREHTPSSSASKRQSTVPHHFGLGARTISPTDARRLKRLSMNPNVPVPGGPVGPPTPQGDFTFDEQAFSQSPAISIRKSETPSSARATPEQNRKSYASGISLSSTSSINSLKVGGSSIPLRTNPTLSSSRLPTAKPRNVHSSAGGETEDVPPVPAIPKAYESPKDPERQTFSFLTTGAKPSTPSAPHQPASASTSAYGGRSHERTNMEASNLNSSTGSIRHRRGLTVGANAEADRTPTMQHSSKKDLQPIRLPPLNLLPLDTPVSNRISSFPAPSGEVDKRDITPPPKRAANKTPSTPMTASKTSFFSGHSGYDFGKHIRSSSSAINLRGSTDQKDHSHGGLSSMPIPNLTPGRQATTPFSSNSLPKGSGEFTRLQSRPSGEFQSNEKDVELQNMKTAGPRPLQKTNTADSTHTSTSTEPETPSSTASGLRRKLSLGGWRRSGSKAASHPSQNQQTRKGPQKTEAPAPQPPKHGDMPPPRLPASATWSGTINTSPTPDTNANRTRPSLDFNRRKPSTATIASENDSDAPAARKETKPAAVRTASGYKAPSGGQPSAKSGSSILPSMQRMLGSKSSSNVLRSRNLDPNLDRDDLMADEEMKKLASKRKDFEHAARDVDALRKRAVPQERVTAAQALQMVNLNIFERGEIIDYKEIYFCGTKNAKKHVGDLNAQSANFGYDDDRGDYNIVFGDHLAYRYEVVDLLGKGSFGQVVRCVDHKTGGLVAIKIIRNKKRFHQQALIEVNILQKLREWDPDNKHSMINFTQSFYFRGHLCISTELLGMNLYEFIKAHEFKGFSPRLIRRFCKQMLASLVLLKSQRVIHCDLKPENILLAHPLHSEIKVIDFGSSCFENEKVYTYIQSRFYRSPEVILGMSYGLPIDMWSLGCILAELLTGYPIFPGENEQEQLACIMEIFGPPEKHLIEKSSRKKLFFDSLGKPRVTVSTKGRRRRPSSKTLQQALKCDDEAFLDFIARCLRWDPERRMRPDEAMQHEFITGARRNAGRRPVVNTAAGTASPVKRAPVAQTPQARVRPLPEPPAAGLKSGAVNNQRVPSSSPVKSNAPRRHSTVSGPPGAGVTGVKRAANGAPAATASNLPRVAQRSVSGKPDFASAAAIASLVSLSPLT